MNDSARLLRDYVANGSEEAFAEVVKNHVDLVYSSALRIVAGDAHLARDVAQMVFTDLARKAGVLPSNAVLPGWLYRHTCFTAAKAVRSERRRQAREREAVAMQVLNEDTDSIWRQMAPVLDDAMNRLGARERDAVVLRFFQQKTLREVGEVLGISEEAARKRVDRAVAVLRNLLRHRGITLSAAALATVISAKSVAAAPSGLATALASASVAAGAAPATVGICSSFTSLLAMTKAQGTVMGLLFIAGVATPIVFGSSGDAQGRHKSQSGPPQPGALQTREQSASASVDAQAKGSTALARLEGWLRQAARTKRMEEGDGVEELRYLISSLPASDYARAWPLANELPPGGRLRDQFQRELLEHWSQLEPRAAMAASLTLKSGSWGRDPAGLALGNWSATEPEAALAWVRQFSSASLLGPRLAQVLPQVARTDPQAALVAISEIESKGLRPAALALVVKEWAAKDPAAAAAYLTNFPPRQRPEFIRSIAEAWARQNPEAALEWARNRAEEGERMSALGGSLAALAETAPAKAAALLSGLQGTKLDLRAFNVSLLARNWAGLDLAAAAGWAKGLSNAWLRAAAVSGVLAQWVELDPRGAADFALSAQDGTEQDGGELDARTRFARRYAVPQGGLPLNPDERLGSILSTWSQRDWRAASDWVNQLPAGAARDAALKGLCQGLAASQPEQAAAFVASMPPGSAQSDAAVDVVGRWAQQDPNAASQWVAAFPQGQTRERAADGLISAWAVASRQPAEAARWLQAEPAGSARDRLAQHFVFIIEDTRPDLAAPWVDAFTDEVVRQDHIEQIARAWLTTDPAAARTWLQGTSLPDEKKQRLLAK